MNADKVVMTVDHFVSDRCELESNEVINFVNHNLCNMMAEAIIKKTKHLTRTPCNDGIKYSKTFYVFTKDELDRFVKYVKITKNNIV